MSLNEHLQLIGSTISRSYNGDRDVTRISFVDPASTSKQDKQLIATRTRPTVVPKQHSKGSWSAYSQNLAHTRRTPTFRFLVDPTHKTSHTLVERRHSGSWLILLTKPRTQSSNADILVPGDPTHKTSQITTVERRHAGSWSSNT